MAGKGNISAVVVAKDVVEQQLEAGFLGGVGFAHVGFPERVGFWETRLEGVGGIGGVDVGFGRAAVARVDADGFAEELDMGEGDLSADGGRRFGGPWRFNTARGSSYLFHFGDERFSARKREARECDVGCC